MHAQIDPSDFLIGPLACLKRPCSRIVDQEQLGTGRKYVGDLDSALFGLRSEPNLFEEHRRARARWSAVAHATSTFARTVMPGSAGSALRQGHTRAATGSGVGTRHDRHRRHHKRPFTGPIAAA